MIARLSESNGRRDRQRQSTRQLGEPALLVFDQWHRDLAPRKTNHQVVAESPNSVVESRCHLTDTSVDQVWMLAVHELLDEVRTHFNFRARPSHSPRL